MGLAVKVVIMRVMPDKLAKMSAVHEELKAEFGQRGDSNPIIDSYIDHKTEEIVFIDKSSDKGFSDSDKTKIREKTKDLKYKIEEIEKKRHSSNCLARSSNCDPMLGGLKVQVNGVSGHGTLGFPAERYGDTGFVITAHQAGYTSGATVKQTLQLQEQLKTFTIMDVIVLLLITIQQNQQIQRFGLPATADST